MRARRRRPLATALLRRCQPRAAHPAHRRLGECDVTLRAPPDPRGAVRPVLARSASGPSASIAASRTCCAWRDRRAASLTFDLRHGRAAADPARRRRGLRQPCGSSRTDPDARPGRGARRDPCRSQLDAAGGRGPDRQRRPARRGRDAHRRRSPDRGRPGPHHGVRRWLRHRRRCREAVFERFASRDAGEKSGFGIGLALARWVVTRHRGTILVSSQGAMTHGTEVAIILHGTSRRREGRDRML